MTQLTRADLDSVEKAALRVGLADQRLLLLAWLPHTLTTRLPLFDTPAKQLRSDLYALYAYEVESRQPALSVWLENAEGLSEIYPGVPDIFAGVRRRLTQSLLSGETLTLPETSASAPLVPPTAVAAPLEQIELLLMATQVRGTGRLSTGDELQKIQNVLRAGPMRERFTTAFSHAVETFEIHRNLLDSTAHVLHFSGHGGVGGRLILQGRDGAPVEVDPDGVRSLIELAQEDRADFRVAIFNACHSADLAQALVRTPAVVPCAIGTSKSIDDDVAIEFSRGFYNSLASGKDVMYAFRAGVTAVGLLGTPMNRQKRDFQIFLADGVTPSTLLLREPRRAEG